MVVDPTPRCVGLEFVRQYYTVLNKAPACLHRFYSNDSKFKHNGEVVMGQTEIHKKIVSLGFHDCHAKIQLVDAFSTLADGVLIQVTGELSNNGMPMRRFTQSIVLAPQSPKKYYVHSDIFHYIDEVFNEIATVEETNNDVEEIEQVTASEDNYIEKVNGTLHEQPEVSSLQTITQPAAPEHGYNVTPIIPSPMQNPPDLSPIPHLNPHHMNEPTIPPRTPSIKDDDEWQTETPPIDDSPIKVEEDKPNPVVVELTKPVPQPVITNEPKTYANLLKNSSSFQSNTMPSVSMNHHVETSDSSVTSNHVTKTRPEPRTSYSKPSGNDWNDSSSGGFQKTNKHFQEDDRRRFVMPDSHQVFIGNLPHTISEEEIKDTFREFGKVVDVRINTAKGKTSSKGTNHPVPNFGFISFDSEESAEKCLEARPIYLNGESRINVEEKKARSSRPMEGGNRDFARPGNRGGPRGGMSQGGRGGGIRGGFNRGENRGGRGSFSQRR